MTPSTIEVLVQVLSEAGNELFAASDDEDEMDEEDETTRRRGGVR